MPYQAPLSPTNMASITPFDNSLITSSPPDAITLHSANNALKQLVADGKPLNTPARNYVRRLTDTTERLRVQISILQREKNDLKEVVAARKQRTKGKRIVLEGKVMISLPEIQRAVANAEKGNSSKAHKKEMLRTLCTISRVRKCIRG